MVQTRSGEVSTASDSRAAPKPAAAKVSKTKIKTKTVNDTAPNEPIEARDDPAKRKRDENETQATGGADSQPPSNEQPPKKAAREEAKEEKEPVSKNEAAEETIIHKINKTIDEYGSLPLTGMAVKEPLKPTPETLLALVIHSMLKSTRISHHLAEKAAVRVIDADYHDIKVLSEASWDDKVKVLSEGGYNRYREATATKLGDLADLVNEKYDGDLNNLLRKAEHKPAHIRELIREIKGFGDVAVDLFCDDAQAVWPVLAPTIDHRSLDTADDVGLGRDIDSLYALLGRDPVQMSKLARGLSNVRLSRSQEEIEHEE
ncbi:hypothetical protein PISL3812_01635 [Talaromyces islandicus]|uniref:HhH-GPD domain-containing protein n=1 Tax=Talaromyces islandicus TaxID=28573 RepID=A0A0U1LMM5_TALIS|nr:hypothetical protein PISL3812_01635 [Talaromyces islandicus]